MDRIDLPGSEQSPFGGLEIRVTNHEDNGIVAGAINVAETETQHTAVLVESDPTHNAPHRTRDSDFEPVRLSQADRAKSLMKPPKPNRSLSERIGRRASAVLQGDQPQGAPRTLKHLRCPVDAHIKTWYNPEGVAAKLDFDLVVLYLYTGDRPDPHDWFFKSPPRTRKPSSKAPVDGPPNLAGSEHGAENERFSGQRQSTLSPNHTNKEPRRVHWLRDSDVLPSLIPPCRVISVGYSLRAPALDSVINLAEAAEPLADELRNLRHSCQKRPILFLAHGFACRIVERLFLRTMDPSYPGAHHQDLHDVCAGLIFYHAPPKGANPVVRSNETSDKPSGNMTVGALNPIEYRNVGSDYGVHHIHLPRAASTSETVARRSWVHHNHMAFSSGDGDVQLLGAQIMEWLESYMLFKAVDHNDFRATDTIISQMKDRGVDISQRRSYRGSNALHIACRSEQASSQLIKLLLPDNTTIDVTAKDEHGRTALHHLVSRPRPDREAIKILLVAGAEVHANDDYNKSPYKLARRLKKMPEIFDLLLKRPCIAGPSAFERSPGVKAPMPTDIKARKACQSTQLAAIEMYLDRKTWQEKHLPRHFWVSDAIYGESSLQKQLDEHRPDETPADLVCHWYHLKTSNLAWVEHLFRNRFDMRSTMWSGQIKDSEWAHGRCINPHASKFTANFGEVEGTVVAACMPFISYEAKLRQDSMREVVLTTQDARKRGASCAASASSRKEGTPRQVPVAKSVEPQSEEAHAEPVTPSAVSAERPSDSDVSGTDDEASNPSVFQDTSSTTRHRHSDHNHRDTINHRNPNEREISDSERWMVEAYLNHEPPLHVRRTLDQWYYYMLSDTSLRDADQVVGRWAEKELDQKNHNILMVDQLWIWIVKGNDGQPDRVVSCFPERHGVGSANADDLHWNVLNLNPRGRRPIATTADLVSRIMATCLDVFAWSEEGKLIRFLQFFEATVGRASDNEITLFKRFKNSVRKLQGLNEGHPDFIKTRDELLTDLLDIRKETELLTEVKDIRDEINIIMNVLRAQETVLSSSVMQQIFRSNPANSKPSQQHPSSVDDGLECAEPLRIVNQNISIFEKLKAQVLEIHQALNYLLDLKQKQANAWEARSARDGAQAAGRAGNVMVIFTMVTIIFLPLSFMASFFALNVSSFPSDQNGQTNWPLHQVSGLLFGISFGFIIPFIAVAFATATMAKWWNGIVSLWLTPVITPLLARADVPMAKAWIDALDLRAWEYKNLEKKFPGYKVAKSPTIRLNASAKTSSSTLVSSQGEDGIALSDLDNSGHVPETSKRRHRRSSASDMA